MNNILQIIDGRYDQRIIEKIVNEIKKKSIVIMPSDTIYGFLALSEKEEEIRQIKQRDKKPFLSIIEGEKELILFTIKRVVSLFSNFIIFSFSVIVMIIINI